MKHYGVNQLPRYSWPGSDKSGGIYLGHGIFIPESDLWYFPSINQIGVMFASYESPLLASCGSPAGGGCGWIRESSHRVHARGLG